MANEVGARIESEIEVKSYIQNLKYALNNGAKINFQENRYVDDAYSARTAHPFQRNGAPFRFRLSKAQQVY